MTVNTLRILVAGDGRGRGAVVGAAGEVMACPHADRIVEILSCIAVLRQFRWGSMEKHRSVAAVAGYAAGLVVRRIVGINRKYRQCY